MAMRKRAMVVVPGLLALSVTVLTACTSQGTIPGPGPRAGSAPTPGGVSASASSDQPTGPAPTSGAVATDESLPTASTGDSTAPSQEPSAVLASSLDKLNELWTDPGCKMALAGFGKFMYATLASPEQGIAAIPAALPQIRAGAGATRNPNAAQAMRKMVTDMQAMADAAKAGQTPDKGPVRNDWQILGNSCS